MNHKFSRFEVKEAVFDALKWASFLTAIKIIEVVLEPRYFVF